MNKLTAETLILAYKHVLKASELIRSRQKRIGDKEYNNNPDSFDDFRYMADKLEEISLLFEHRYEDAVEQTKDNKS